MRIIILFIALLCSCSKQVKQPIKANEVKYCNDFAGTWICLNDTSIKDSLVIDVSNQIDDTTYYKSNIPFFAPVLKHKCPYKWQDDYLHLTINNKKYLFTYQH